jgi:hypothetical protein
VPSEHHEQSDKGDGDNQDPGGSRVHAFAPVEFECSILQLMTVCRYARMGPALTATGADSLAAGRGVTRRRGVIVLNLAAARDMRDD